MRSRSAIEFVDVVAATFVVGKDLIECDFTSLSEAIAALPAGGGEIKLLQGTYTIPSSLVVSKHVKLSGVSRGGVVLDFGATATAFSVTADIGLEIESLACQGNGSVGQKLISFSAAVQGSYYNSLRDVDAWNWEKHALADAASFPIMQVVNCQLQCANLSTSRNWDGPGYLDLSFCYFLSASGTVSRGGFSNAGDNLTIFMVGGQLEIGGGGDVASFEAVNVAVYASSGSAAITPTSTRNRFSSCRFRDRSTTPTRFIDFPAAAVDSRVSDCFFESASSEQIRTASTGGAYTDNQNCKVVEIGLANLNYIDNPGAAYTLLGVQSRSGKNNVRNVRDFGAVGNDSANDQPAIQLAIDACGAGDTVYFPRGIYRLASGLTWKNGVNARFENVTLAYIGAGPADMITMTSVSDIAWFGRVVLKSTAPGASNEVYGIEADDVARWHVDTVHFEDLARGLEAANLDTCSFKVITGKSLRGDIQGSADAVGSILTLNGCIRVTIGQILGDDIYKAAVYLATSTAGGASTDNEEISIGEINIVLNSGAVTNNGLAIRSGKRVTVGSVIVLNGYRGVIIQQESGDTGLSIEDVAIGSIVCKDVDNTTSGEGLHVQSLEATKTIKNLSIGQIVIDGAQDFGCYIDDVVGLSIGSIIAKSIAGGASEMGVRFEDIVNGTVGQILVDTIDRDGVRLVDCDRLSIGEVVGIDVGLNTHNTFDVLRADSDCTNCRVESVTGFASNAALAHARVVDVIGGGRSICSVGNTRSVNHGASQPVIFNSTTFDDIQDGRLLDTAAPTGGTWAVGDLVYDSAPAALGFIGFVCVTAGTPGTWKTWGVISA